MHSESPAQSCMLFAGSQACWQWVTLEPYAMSLQQRSVPQSLGLVQAYTRAAFGASNGIALIAAIAAASSTQVGAALKLQNGASLGQRFAPQVA